MTTKPYVFSCKAVVRDPQGHCLLLRRSAASKHNAGLWDFPGGKLDAGEDPAQALTREIREETGLDVELTRVAGAAESELPDRKVAYLIFEARASSTGMTLSSEHDAFEWVEPKRLTEMRLCDQFRSFAAAYAAGPASRAVTA
jgi:8-oxo-dGTP diphosphatase